MRLFAELDPAGVAVFFGVVALVVAAYTRAPDHWGVRRIAFGVFTACAGIALLILTPAMWWWSGVLFGGYQIYVGWSFLSRRSGIADERIGYLASTAKVLSMLALTDGDLSSKDLEIIHEVYRRVGFASNELHEVELVARDCEREFRGHGSNPDQLAPLVQDACRQVSQHCNYQTRLIVLETAVLIVASDGYVSQVEERALRAAATWLGLSARDVDDAWQAYAMANRSFQPEVSDSTA